MKLPARSTVVARWQSPRVVEILVIQAETGNDPVGRCLVNRLFLLVEPQEFVE